ncbi:MAG: hypothetical protein A3H31_06320 [Gallionellales bacterium RIFCSPLOWO2_02_FULL_57_47]|nr:MAG: hypothetical protein A3H31_06320 [Gallionellales bacterium RIFCSPLOWO2_02_FULL_57_47]
MLLRKQSIGFDSLQQPIFRSFWVELQNFLWVTVCMLKKILWRAKFVSDFLMVFWTNGLIKEVLEENWMLQVTMLT